MPALDHPGLARDYGDRVSGAVVSSAATDSPGSPSAARPDGVARGCDLVLDATVVVLATWTVVYHASLLLDLGSNAALAIEVALVVVAAVAWLSRRSHPDTGSPGDLPADLPLEHRWDRFAAVTVAAAVVAAVGMAVEAPWAVVWVAWLVAGAAGTAYAARRLTWTVVRAPGHPDRRAVGARGGAAGCPRAGGVRDGHPPPQPRRPLLREPLRVGGRARQLPAARHPLLRPRLPDGQLAADRVVRRPDRSRRPPRRRCRPAPWSTSSSRR